MRHLIVSSFLLVSASANADTLRMMRIESTNMHMADEAGAMHWTEDYTITLVRGAKGKATVTSAGTREDHSMTVMNNTPYNTDDRATWRTTWRGTWSVKGTTLSLALDLVKHDCTGEKDDNGTKSAKPCKTASAAAKLECTTMMLDVQNAARTKTTKSAAWMCSPAAGTELAESAGSWVFAKSGCVQVNGGHKSANSFARCP